MVGILVIGSYIYHSDVLATNTQVYEYKYISLTIHQFIAYTNLYRGHSVPQISSSVWCRL